MSLTSVSNISLNRDRAILISCFVLKVSNSEINVKTETRENNVYNNLKLKNRKARIKTGCEANDIPFEGFDD